MKTLKCNFFTKGVINAASLLLATLFSRLAAAQTTFEVPMQLNGRWS